MRCNKKCLRNLHMPKNLVLLFLLFRVCGDSLCSELQQAEYSKMLNMLIFFFFFFRVHGDCLRSELQQAEYSGNFKHALNYVFTSFFFFFRVRGDGLWVLSFDKQNIPEILNMLKNFVLLLFFFFFAWRRFAF
jgi:hypothetical protein